jgi:hypothetical protein
MSKESNPNARNPPNPERDDMDVKFGILIK